MPLSLYLIAFISAAILTAGLTPLIKKIAIKYNIIDRPTAPRKIHSRPIPLLGGSAIFLSFLIVVLIFLYFGMLSDNKISSNQIATIILAGLLLIFGGFLDDKYNLKPIQQLILPLMAVLLIVASGIKIQYVTNPFGPVLQFPLITGSILAFLWILGMVYTTKFLDGLDGLVAGTTVIGSIIIFIVSLYWDNPSSPTSFLAIILAGAVLGFLPFNWQPAKIFLGEGGSVFCGFMLGVLAILSGSKIATTLLIMGIPILDVIWVITRRIWQGKSPVSGDRKHLHFRLLDIGLSHRQSVTLLLFLSASFGTTSLFLHTRGKMVALIILSLVMIILAISLISIYKLKQQK